MEVFKLISGPRVFICSECSARCVHVLEKVKAAEAIGTTLDDEDAKEVKTLQRDEKLRCSFCGKSQRDVDKLIAGPEVCICDACIEISVQIIKEAKAAQKPSS